MSTPAPHMDSQPLELVACKDQRVMKKMLQKHGVTDAEMRQVTQPLVRWMHEHGIETFFIEYKGGVMVDVVVGGERPEEPS